MTSQCSVGLGHTCTAIAVVSPGLLYFDAISEDTSAFACNVVQSVIRVHSMWVECNYKALGKTFRLSQSATLMD